MTPLEAAKLLESVVGQVKRRDIAVAMRMGIEGLKNSAMAREVLEKSGKHELTIQYIRDANGAETFVVWPRGGPTVAAGTLSEALTGSIEKAARKGDPCPP